MIPPRRRAARRQERGEAAYRAAQRRAGGRCPIEAGLICRLADHECRHGRLAFFLAAVKASPLHGGLLDGLEAYYR
jgi:hypothetical protein